MRYPQVIVFERDGRCAWLLKELCAERRWSLRESRQVEGCLRLLRGGGPVLLVVRIVDRPGKEPSAEEREQERKLRERAFQLIDRAAALRPDITIVAVSEQVEPALAALAWDLGAAYVLTPPEPLSNLRALAGHFMTPATASTPGEE